MNDFCSQTAMASGLVVPQAARGAQVNLLMAGHTPSFLHRYSPRCCRFDDKPQASPRVRGICSHPPNAIKVGASSDHERSASLTLGARR